MIFKFNVPVNFSQSYRNCLNLVVNIVGEKKTPNWVSCKLQC